MAELLPILTAFVTAMGGFAATLFAFLKFLAIQDGDVRKGVLEDNKILRESVRELRVEVDKLEALEETRRVERNKLRRIVKVMREALAAHNIPIVLSSDLEQLINEVSDT